MLELDGLVNLAKRNTNLLLGGYLPDAMLVELPEDQRTRAMLHGERMAGWRIRKPASGGDGLNHARKLIRDLCLRHGDGAPVGVVPASGGASSKHSQIGMPLTAGSWR